MEIRKRRVLHFEPKVKEPMKRITAEQICETHELRKQQHLQKAKACSFT